MSKYNYKVFLWAFSLLVILTWIAIVILTNDNSVSLLSYGAIRKIPMAITSNVLFWGAFFQWFWSHKIFQGWLVLTPSITGKWVGKIESTFIPEGSQEPMPPIDAELTVHQTFFNTCICVKTGEMESRSFASTWMYDPETKKAKLCYSYTSNPDIKIRDRSPVHEGTAILEYQNDGKALLQGCYWTGRKTTGTMTFSKAE